MVDVAIEIRGWRDESSIGGGQRPDRAMKAGGSKGGRGACPHPWKLPLRLTTLLLHFII